MRLFIVSMKLGSYAASTWVRFQSPLCGTFSRPPEPGRGRHVHRRAGVVAEQCDAVLLDECPRAAGARLVRHIEKYERHLPDIEADRGLQLRLLPLYRGGRQFALPRGRGCIRAAAPALRLGIPHQVPQAKADQHAERRLSVLAVLVRGQAFPQRGVQPRLQRVRAHAHHAQAAAAITALLGLFEEERDAAPWPGPIRAGAGQAVLAAVQSFQLAEQAIEANQVSAALLHCVSVAWAANDKVPGG
jgi:hypothetical protein